MKEKITCIIILCISFISFAQDGNPDLMYGDNGVVITGLDDEVSGVYGLDQNTDGKNNCYRKHISGSWPHQ